MPHFKLPDPGEGLVEAEIVTWKVKAGDQVKTNDIVVEIETAKSLVELPIPWDGTVLELLVPEGETVEVGTPIIVIDNGDGGGGAGGGAAGAAAADAPGAGVAAPTEEAPKREANLVGYGPSEGSTSRRPRRRSTSVPDAPPPPASAGDGRGTPAAAPAATPPTPPPAAAP
ncbi:biotin/lipoyl-containing protein, partial [Ornithinicoccus hortensis]